MNTLRPGLVYICQRPGCGATHFEPHQAPETEVRRLLNAGLLYTAHSCPSGGGAVGICILVGTATTFANAAEQVAAMKGTAA
jgi:hypothetical protein